MTSLSYDPEIKAVLEQAASAGRPAPPARGDWETLRARTEMLMAAVAPAARPPSVSVSNYSTTTWDGDELSLRWYTRAGSTPGSAVVYSHGGGLVCGTLDLYDAIISRYVESSGVPFLAVEYRRAPEARDTSLTRDVFAAIVWLHEHANDLGVDPDRVAVMGDSGGGAPAAGAAIMARDHGVPLARQLLIYPMLDDRNTVPDPTLEPLATWTYDNNFTGWSALLGEAIGTEDVSELAAPARAKDLSGVAPAYLDVGELDIFRDETINYARLLSACGVSVELHVHPGAPHAFEGLAPGAAVSQRVLEDRNWALTSL
ncbi:alpha/beta hydrolase fold domain-containing protein [Aeromicrobium sp. S22]|uniref:alpha/beta hydrolase fold domain-containing protein n=1 Tax=Aeromicrobium sp. S22 TaxID=2662029 RepID=UPI00129E86FD|nr:alpha/beta hydrolase fold domain-containing protein [Aeromicrobium sp. S22]MRK02600.1 alpha/beta hydrolase fold domain-containing protein [Aeromicrobium sp. S22]